MCCCRPLYVLLVLQHRQHSLASLSLATLLLSMIASPADEPWTSSDMVFVGAELAGEVMEVYKEAGAMAWHSLPSCLHSAYSRCATTLAEGIIILNFLWKELCGDCQCAMRALTGDFSAVVMGCEMVVLLLVASVVCKYSSHIVSCGVCACQPIDLPCLSNAPAVISCDMLC